MSIKLVSRSIWRNPGNSGRRIRKTIDAILWQAQKRTTRSRRLLTLPNGTRFWAHPDCVVSSSLIYADWPEHNELMFLRKNLASGEAIIDIGANAGHISLLLADLVGHDNVFAFEPTPVSFERLKANWELNGWPVDKLFQTAVGASSGTVFMLDVKSPLSTNQVRDVPGDGNHTEVPLVTLDEFRPALRSRRIGLLKIDVEGYEERVFCGWRELLQNDRPHFIMFESLAGTLDSTIASTLGGCGYVVFQLDSRGFPDFENPNAQNLFAIPEERRGDLEN